MSRMRNRKKERTNEMQERCPSKINKRKNDTTADVGVEEDSERIKKVWMETEQRCLLATRQG